MEAKADYTATNKQTEMHYKQTDKRQKFQQT